VKIGPPYMGYVTSAIAAAKGDPLKHRNDGISTNRAESTSHITVSDCFIHGGGRIHPAAIGVWVGKSSYNKIVHCEISDFFYSAVSMGWCWGYEPSQANHNEVAFNHLHTIGQGVLSDMGAIYTLGVSPGTIIHDNHVHDVNAHAYGGWGLYTDEGSSGIRLYNNLVYRTKTGGFHQNHGKGNIVENNIFALAKLAQLQRSRAETEHIGFFFRNNIVYWNDEGKTFLGSYWSGAKVGLTAEGKPTETFLFSSNLYWHAGGKTAFFPKDVTTWEGWQPWAWEKPDNLTLEAWQEEFGQDEGSRVANPCFADPEKGDFTFKCTKAAESIGFKPFDVVTTTGPRVAVPFKPASRIPAMYENATD